MNGNQILLLLLPVELFSLKLTGVLDFLAFFLESLVSKVIDFLDVMNVLFTFMLSMVIDFERTL